MPQPKPPKPLPDPRRVGDDPSDEDLALGAQPGDWIVSYDDGSRKAVEDQQMRTMAIRPLRAW